MLALCAAMLAVAGTDQLLPIDEGPKDKQFLEFRTNMVAAIKKKNYGYVLGRIADDIKWSFGGGNGKASLIETWAFLETEEGFYKELLTILELGGQFRTYDRTRYFIAPYVFSAWPNKYDPYDFAAATNEKVPVYSESSTGSSKVGFLNLEIVKVVRGGEYMKGWKRINFGGGQAWVQDGPVRNPIDYRALFEKRRGSWYMVTFIAGD